MRVSPRSAVMLLAALGASCDAGRPAPTPTAAAARALVRPYVARNGLRVKAPTDGSRRVVPGPTAVVLAHEAEDGTLRVGCVDSEDGAEDLVRSVEDTR